MAHAADSAAATYTNAATRRRSRPVAAGRCKAPIDRVRERQFVLRAWHRPAHEVTNVERRVPGDALRIDQEMPRPL